MREIEVKYRVDDLEALLVALKERGIDLSEPVRDTSEMPMPTVKPVGLLASMAGALRCAASRYSAQ